MLLDSVSNWKSEICCYRNICTYFLFVFRCLIWNRSNIGLFFFFPFRASIETEKPNSRKYFSSLHYQRRIMCKQFYIGEGNGAPLQYSCLENPMDGGAWWAAVHGVARSRTRLSDFTFTFPFHALEKEMATHSSALAWRIPGMGEPGGLPSMGSHRVGHDWSDLAVAAVLHSFLNSY